MNVQIIPFRARHVPLIKPEAGKEWLELAEAAQENGRGYTACLLGDPIGAAGVRLHAQGIGEAWALFSPLIKAMPKSLFKSVSKGLNEIIAEEKLTKIWALVDPEDETAQQFMEHLGFRMKHWIYEREVWKSQPSCHS